MIQYLGEHKLFNEKYIIFILFCIFLIEFKNYFSHKNKEKGYTLVISLMYLGAVSYTHLTLPTNSLV